MGGESLIAEQIEEWENNLPDFIKLAFAKPREGSFAFNKVRGTNELSFKN